MLLKVHSPDRLSENGIRPVQIKLALLVLLEFISCFSSALTHSWILGLMALATVNICLQVWRTSHISILIQPISQKSVLGVIMTDLTKYFPDRNEGLPGFIPCMCFRVMIPVSMTSGEGLYSYWVAPELFYSHKYCLTKHSAKHSLNTKH